MLGCSRSRLQVHFSKLIRKLSKVPTKTTAGRKEDDGGVNIGTATGVYMQYRDYYRDPLPHCPS